MSAKELFDKIDDIRQPVKRPSNDKEDRVLRNMIHAAQEGGDVIINLGVGYFRVDTSDPEQVMLAKRYLNKRKSHIRRNAECIRAMERTLGNLDQMELEL